MADLHDFRSSGRMTDDEHEQRMAVARRQAQWDLGDPSWAGVIVAAYLSPEVATTVLDEQGAPS